MSARAGMRRKDLRPRIRTIQYPLKPKREIIFAEGKKDIGGARTCGAAFISQVGVRGNPRGQSNEWAGEAPLQ
jgi:hypothetical protein